MNGWFVWDGHVGNIIYPGLGLARDLQADLPGPHSRQKKRRELPLVKSRLLKYYNLARYKLQPTTSTMDPMANVGKYTSPMDGMGMAWQ